MKKQNERQQGNPFLAGLALLALILIILGNYIHNVQVMLIGFACIPVGVCFAFIPQIIGLINSDRILESFSKSKTGRLPLKKRTAELIIPPIFHGQLGEITFNHITNIIEIQSGFIQ